MPDFDIAAYVSRIEANRSVKDALMQSLKTRRPPYRISVTDLLNIKQAYFRRKYPEITPSLEKQQLMWAGTGPHELLLLQRRSDLGILSPEVSLLDVKQVSHGDAIGRPARL